MLRRGDPTLLPAICIVMVRKTSRECIVEGRVKCVLNVRRSLS